MLSKLRVRIELIVLVVAPTICGCECGGESANDDVFSDAGPTTGQADACQPLSCQDLGLTCGVADDGCGSELRCTQDATEEICDGLDNNCNGEIDEQVVLCTNCCDADEDQDGCEDDQLTCHGCQDVGGTIEEICNDCQDNDCDGEADESPCAEKGTLLWAKATTGTGSARAEDVVVSSDGDSIVTGSFNGSVTLGAGDPTQTTLESTSNDDLFLARYDEQGQLLWAKRAVASGTAMAEIRARAVAVGSDGSIWVTGRFIGTALFGPGEPQQSTLDSEICLLMPEPCMDVFLAKYASDGTLLWARKDGGPANEDGMAVAIALNGDAIVTGLLEDGAVFGWGQAGQSIIDIGMDPPNSAIFVARYDSGGTLQWVRRAGGDTMGFNSGQSVAVNSDGHALVTGYIATSAVFGLGEANQITLTSLGGNDGFLARYDGDGNLGWATHAGSNSVDEGASVAVNAAGVFWTGRFSTTATFGVGEPGQTQLSATGTLGAQEGYVAHYDSSGAVLWAARFGGDYFDTGSDIALASDGAVIVAGEFWGQGGAADFGAEQACETVVTTPLNDAFVAKYGADGALYWVRTTQSVDSSSMASAWGVSTSADGTIRVVGQFIGSVTFGLGEPGQCALNSSSPFGPSAFVASYGP